jgi:hypothetical protein
MTVRKNCYFAAMMIMGFALISCERIRIGEINSDPGRFMHKEVAVAGMVTQSIGAFGKGIYQLDDGTGTLWVLSGSRGVPSKGARVGVKGTVTPTVTFLGINYATVMQESDRRAE